MKHLKKIFLVIPPLLSYPIYPQAGLLLEALEGASVGFHLGIEPFGGDIYPYQEIGAFPSGIVITSLGFSIKYKKAFLFLRASIEYQRSIRFKSTIYTWEGSHAPFSIGMHLPLSEDGSLYVFGGGGYYQVSFSTNEKKYSLLSYPPHFGLGSEFRLSKTSSFSLEWLHTTGRFPISETRTLSLQSDFLIIAYNYYFILL